jgi:5-oxoprolinase (ATP-hydrolysing) subunit A
MRTIDLNADLGEGGAFDAQLFPLISSANIACGYHAGDRETMIASIRLAQHHGVAIGAHPGLKDKAGFGRTWIDVSSPELYAHVVDQITTLSGICDDEGASLRYVKAHGALYNVAANETPIATIIASAIVAVNPGLAVFAQPGSVMEQTAQDHGLRVLAEAFADRAYNADGTLVSRDIPGAVLHDPVAIADRMERLVTKSVIETIDHQTIPLRADTICLHSDTQGAVEIAKALRSRFASLGIAVRANT